MGVTADQFRRDAHRRFAEWLWRSVVGPKGPSFAEYEQWEVSPEAATSADNELGQLIIEHSTTYRTGEQPSIRSMGTATYADHRQPGPHLAFMAFVRSGTSLKRLQRDLSAAGLPCSLDGDLSGSIVAIQEGKRARLEVDIEAWLDAGASGNLPLISSDFDATLNFTQPQPGRGEGGDVAGINAARLFLLWLSHPEVVDNWRTISHNTAPNLAQPEKLRVVGSGKVMAEIEPNGVSIVRSVVEQIQRVSDPLARIALGDELSKTLMPAVYEQMMDDAAEFRADGGSWKEIGQRLDVTASAAQNRLDPAARARAAERARERRQGGAT